MKATYYSAKNNNYYLIVNNGIGTQQKKYAEFARHLCNQNINVITYDYRDMPENSSISRKSTVSISDWVNENMNKVIESVYEKNKNARVFILGHSLGGQIIGLSHFAKKADGIILVATQTGYYKFWKFPYNLVNYFFWKIFVPLTITFSGHLPFKAYGIMENIPGKIAREWNKWCKSPNYLFDHVPAEKRYFSEIRCPVLSLSFDDDYYATKKAVDWFTAQYTNAPVDRIHFKSPNTKYTHSALFEPENFPSMIPQLVQFIYKKND